MQEGPAKAIPGKMCGYVHVHSPVRPQAHAKLCICKCVSVSIHYVLSLVGQAHPVLIMKVVRNTGWGMPWGRGRWPQPQGTDMTLAFRGACIPVLPGVHGAPAWDQAVPATPLTL